MFFCLPARRRNDQQGSASCLRSQDIPIFDELAGIFVYAQFIASPPQLTHLLLKKYKSYSGRFRWAIGPEGERSERSGRCVGGHCIVGKKKRLFLSFHLSILNYSPHHLLLQYQGLGCADDVFPGGKPLRILTT